jgi:hypothetical protein
MTDKGKLYLIPSPLGENDPAEVVKLLDYVAERWGDL